MASSYPSTFDSTAGPSASDKTNSVTYPHATLHTDAIGRAVAMQHRVGLHSTAISGSSYPSTNIGDSLAVESTSGLTAWGTHHPSKIGTFVATSSGTASVDFTGIPPNFGGLLVRAVARSESTAAVDTMTLQLGSTGAAIDTSTAYDSHLFQGTGGSVASFPTAGSTFINAGTIPGSTGPATLGAVSELLIHDYNSTAHRKPVTGHGFSQDVTTSSSTFRSAKLGGTWNSTAPIGKVRVAISGGANFSVGSRFDLYGWP